MSNFHIKHKKKIINIKTLILQTNDQNNLKSKQLKLSLLKNLFQTNVANQTNALTERNEKSQKSSSRKKMGDLCKTMRETNPKTIKKINFNSKNNGKNIFFDNNFNKILNKFNFSRCGEDDSINTNMVNTYRENMKIRNLLLEYSGIKPKKEQKFLQGNKKFIHNKKLINKYFLNSSSLVYNSTKNNNNSTFKTNNSNTLNESKVNNFTQRSIHLKYPDLNPQFTKVYQDKNNSHSKKKINISNTNNFAQLLINKTYIKNNIKSTSRKILNIFKNKSCENENNSKNHSNIKNEKKKRIQLLIKPEQKSIKKTLPYREKLLNDIKRNIISKNKYNFININNKKINFENVSNKLNNTITISNNSRKNKIKKIQEKKITKRFTKNNKNININNSISELQKKHKEQKINCINLKYTKKIVHSPTPPKTKDNTITTTMKDPVYKKVIKIDSCTLAGYNSKGIQKINQDNLFIKKDFLDEKDQFFIGVCDGHGDYGHSVSSYISKCLPNFLADTSDKNIVSSYNSLNRNLVENSKIDCSISGTTCSSIILNPEKIISLNLGDSRSVLAKYERGVYTAIDLSTDHKPNIGTEKKRILINGGRIKPYYNEKTKKFLGPDRVWLKDNDLPGLAMTRSFGDTLAHSVGVIAEPEIKRYDFSGNEKFIIIASDGIWEYISSAECVNIVKEFYEKNLDAAGAINALMKEAFNRWKKFDEIIDDITAIIIFFDPK